jgi:hypothetical protein
MYSIQLEEKGAGFLEGVIDLHVYVAPSLYERAFTELDFARQARSVGYRGIVVKSHHAPNADRCQTVMEAVPGIGVYGGVVLNHSVGGLNPFAVEAAIGFGAKLIWMPNIHSAHHIEVEGAPEYANLRKRTHFRGRSLNPTGISILTSDMKVRSEVVEILGMIAANDIILGTGHLSVQEGFALVKAAREQGVKKILVQHPEASVTDWQIEEQVKIADLGAVLEHNFFQCDQSGLAPEVVAQAIKAVGPHRCVMATGLGQSQGTHPIEGMRRFIQVMLLQGIGESEISVMTKELPARLLGLT